MEAIYQDQKFSAHVKKHFDFLINEYGFRSHHTSLGYVKDVLELEFYHGKGELDVIFFVRRDDEVFRPFVSRSFDLIDIVKRQAGRELTWPSNLPEYIISMEDVDIYLSFLGEVTKKYCKEQLN